MASAKMVMGYQCTEEDARRAIADAASSIALADRFAAVEDIGGGGISVRLPNFVWGSTMVRIALHDSDPLVILESHSLGSRTNQKNLEWVWRHVEAALHGLQESPPSDGTD